MSTTATVEASGLVRRFGAAVALDGVDLTVRRHSVHGLLGPNGAGKTTLLRVLVGLVRPDAGSVKLLGRPAGGPGRTALDGVAALVDPPRFRPPRFRRRNLELLAGPGGLAGAAARSVRLVLLDEPSAGLDPAGARDLRGLLRGLAADGVTVLLSSHDMAEVEQVCDAVTILSAGRVAYSGELDRLRADAPEAEHDLWTADDTAAMVVAEGLTGLAEPLPGGGLRVCAGQAELDSFVLALGRAGIAVRRLERSATGLETMFFRLTAGAA